MDRDRRKMELQAGILLWSLGTIIMLANDGVLWAIGAGLMLMLMGTIALANVIRWVGEIDAELRQMLEDGQDEEDNDEEGE